MAEENFRGVYPVLSVPFTAKGDVDYKSLRKLISFLLNRGVDGLTIFGLNSEFYKLDDNESKKIIHVLIEENNYRKKIIIGVGRPGTEATIAQVRICEKLGVDGLIIFPPYCVPISSEQLFNHYVEVANSTPLPIIIQDSPKYSGVDMSLNFFTSLASTCKNIKYAKIENQLSGPKITNIINGSKGKLSVFAGKGGTHYMEHLNRGVCGIMPGCAIIELFINIFKFYNEGKKELANQIFEDIATFLYLEDQEIEYYIASEKLILAHRRIFTTSLSRKPSAVLDSLAENFLLKQFEYFREKYNLS